MAKNYNPLDIPITADRELRLRLQRRGQYFPAGFQTNPETGQQEFTRGGFFNPGGRGVQGEDVGPNYQERLAAMGAGANQPPQPIQPQQPLTPQDHAQNWQDAHTLATANQKLFVAKDERMPGGFMSGTPQGIGWQNPPIFPIFGNVDHLDSHFVRNGMEGVPTETRAAYQRETRNANQKLYGGLARRGQPFQTPEDVQEFVNTLGMDDRVGGHVENEMEKVLAKTNPALLQKIYGQREVNQANENALRRWAVQSGLDVQGAIDPNDPNLLAQFERESPEQYTLDPITNKPMLREPTPQIAAMQEVKAETSKFNELQKYVTAHPELNQVAILKNGKAITMDADEYRMEQQAKQEKLQGISEQKTIKQETRVQKQREKLESREDKLNNELRDIRIKRAAALMPAEKSELAKIAIEINTELADIKGQITALNKPVEQPNKTPSISTEQTLPPVPPPTEQTATNPQTGQKVVLRNGQWIPL
jgi:hypothetical protein